jgi:transcriptional regulator with XRE-family HTH domain
MNRRAGGKLFPDDSGPRRKGLGRAIQALRAERGLKRQRLAEDAGLSYAYLAEIENGKKEPSTRVLDAIARALGIRLPELMEVAESLQAIVQEAKDEALRPAMRAQAKSPLMARMASAPDRPWFHSSPQEAASRLTEILETDSAGPPGPQSRERMLEELRARASQLSPQDLERLLDIARRLST